MRPVDLGEVMDEDRDAEASNRRRKKKPKRAPSAYLLFCAENRAKLVSLDLAAQSKSLSMAWKVVSPAEKARFESRAQNEKASFE